MPFGNMCNLHYCRTYEEAERIFNTIPQPRGRAWGRNERPLGNNRQHHYRAEKHEGFYDVVLYATPMARYYEPEADGTRVVYYTTTSTQTSRAFLRYVVGRSEVWEEQGLRIPIYDYTTPRSPTDNGYATFSLKLTRLGDGTIDVTRSAHTPHGVSRMTKEGRTQLAALVKQHASIVDAAVMRYDSHKHIAKKWGNNMFTGADGAWHFADAVRRGCVEAAMGVFMETVAPSLFHAMWERFDARVNSFNNRWGRVKEMPAPPTIETYRASCTSFIRRTLKSHVEHETVELPQFSLDVPRTSVRVL